MGVGRVREGPKEVDDARDDGRVDVMEERDDDAGGGGGGRRVLDVVLVVNVDDADGGLLGSFGGVNRTGDTFSYDESSMESPSVDVWPSRETEWKDEMDDAEVCFGGYVCITGSLRLLELLRGGRGGATSTMGVTSTTQSLRSMSDADGGDGDEDVLDNDSKACMRDCTEVMVAVQVWSRRH